MILQFMSSAGGICYMPPCMFFLYRKRPSPEMLDYSEGCLKCLTCPTKPPTSSFLVSKYQMKFREQKHCIFNLCPVYCKQQTILGWQSEEFQSSDIQLNHPGGKVNCGKCVIRNTVGLALAGPYTIIHEVTF